MKAIDGGNERIDSLNRSIGHLLHRAGQYASELFSTTAGPDGLTPRQFAVLVAVAQNEGLSQTDLVNLTGIDRSTLADIVRRMIKKGLLERQRTPEDQRAYAVRLSSDGRLALRGHMPYAAAVDAKLLGSLPDALREPFVAALAEIARMVSRGGSDALDVGADNSLHVRREDSAVA